jgi:hypothetical protein
VITSLVFCSVAAERGISFNVVQQQVKRNIADYNQYQPRYSLLTPKVMLRASMNSGVTVLCPFSSLEI